MIYSKNMVDLQDSPEAILEAKDGDMFTLHEHSLKLYKGKMYCYLSLVRESEEETFVSLGNRLGYSLFTPQEMVELIKSKDWVIE